MRFAIEIVKQIRSQVGEKFIIIYRLSMLDLISDGSQWQETVELAQAIEISVNLSTGGVTECPNVPVLKTGDLVRGPRVQISPPPPSFLQ